jgi:hypothetical protein
MSTVKVNTVDKRTGGTLTLGGCGTTVTLGAGATQSGFGRTGTVDWCTTAKTAPFTGVSGNGYFVNTTSGVVTVTLPASPSAGDIISIADYASTFQTNNVTLCNNSSKINGVCATAGLSTQGQSVTLVYVDATRGWKNTMDSTSNVTATPNYIIATGGTISCCGDYKIHTFTSDGCFAVTNAGTPAGSNTVSYLVVAGGGGGAGQETASSAGGGGAGAGGYREGKVSGDPYTASPIAAATGLPVSVTSYPITVGGGGATWSSPYTTACSRGVNGSNSIFSTITSAGGGGGGARTPSGPIGGTPGASGGSGGGVGGVNCSATAGSGNTPPTNPSQGNPGGTRSGLPQQAAGGGGGATAAGGNGSGNCGGVGGAGATSSINGTPTARAGGGSGGDAGNSQAGGTGGGGASGAFCGGSTVGGPATSNGQAGTVNTGGGGGGSGGSCSPYNNGGAGGSGIVIIRYKFQN